MNLHVLAYFFTPGPWELIVIGGIVLLLFGSRLPSVMRSLGQSVVEFKKGVSDKEEGEAIDGQAGEGEKSDPSEKSER